MASALPRIWLLVEDDENDYLLLRRALQRSDPGAVLFWVKDGTEAQDFLLGRERFKDRALCPTPAVVLSDLKMPRCSGLELVLWIRQQPALRTIPFIMFSSSDQAADVGSAYQDGANWYLAKPSTFQELIEMLRRLAENLSLSQWQNPSGEP
jgi:CheY-like chemotaxis protein